MAYVKNTWYPGDLLTADRLNHIENGIEEFDLVFPITATLKVDENEDQYLELDKTGEEISLAFKSGKACVVTVTDEFEYRSLHVGVYLVDNIREDACTLWIGSNYSWDDGFSWESYDYPRLYD